MQLSEKHISFIENSLGLYGVTSKDLKEDLVDHICTYIENQDSDDFNKLYQKALRKFGGYSNFQNLQIETNVQKFAKELITLNKFKFTIGCAVVLLLVSSLLFKMMHWPYANALLLSAIVVSAFALLPVHFYVRYKTSVHKFS